MAPAVTVKVSGRPLRYHRLGEVRDRVPLTIFLLILVLLQVPISFPSVVPLAWDGAVSQFLFGTPVRSSLPPVLSAMATTDGQRSKTAAPSKPTAEPPAKPAPAEGSWLAWASKQAPPAPPKVAATASASIAKGGPLGIEVSPSMAAALHYQDFITELRAEVTPLALAPVVLAGLVSWALILTALRSFGMVVIHTVYGTMAALFVYLWLPYLRTEPLLFVPLTLVLLVVFFIWFRSKVAMTVLIKVAAAILARPALFAVVIGRMVGLVLLMYWAILSAPEILTNPVGVLARVAQAILLANYWYVHSRDFMASRLVASYVAMQQLPSSSEAAQTWRLQWRSLLAALYDGAGTSAYSIFLGPFVSIAAVLVVYLQVALWWITGLIGLAFLALVVTTAGLVLYPEDGNSADFVPMLLGTALAFGACLLLWKFHLWLTNVVKAAIIAMPIAGVAGLDFADSFAVGTKIHDKVSWRILFFNMIALNLYLMASLCAAITAMICVSDLSLMTGYDVDSSGSANQWAVALMQQNIRLAAIFVFNWLMRDLLDSLVLVIEITEVISTTQFSFGIEDNSGPINVGYQFHHGDIALAAVQPRTKKEPETVEAPTLRA